MKKITRMLMLVITLVIAFGVLSVGAVDNSYGVDNNIIYGEMLNFKPFAYHIEILDSREMHEQASIATNNVLASQSSTELLASTNGAELLASTRSGSKNEAALPYIQPEKYGTKTFVYPLGRNGVQIGEVTITVSYVWSRTDGYSEILDVDAEFSDDCVSDFVAICDWTTYEEKIADDPDTLLYDAVEVWLTDTIEKGHAVITYTIYHNGTFTEDFSY